ncbi:MAG TPA: hypothetical protein PKC18_05945 [Lacipirellulaceae bacterium]|nr:hypothetical protein [Lacipirellulaceae bacterium]HMP05038.1 hypothetical protein [Lacipirellulaceae bacterium]
MMTHDSLWQLNRLLTILCRSFVQYLRWARPYVTPGQDEIIDSLGAIAEDQDALADRVSRMIVEAGGLPRSGDFPMEFTDLHDLRIDFLAAAAVRYQEYDVAAMLEISESLTSAPAARSLAEEALGMAKGQLDALRELARTPVISV